MTITRLTFTEGPDSYKAKDLSDYVLTFLAGDDLLRVNAATKVSAKMGDGKDTVTFGKADARVSIDGGAGDDVFNGRHLLQDGVVYGGAGSDRYNDFVNADGHRLVMSGGLGDDVYRLDPLHPATIRELAGEGIDLVQIAVGMNYTMARNIENLQVVRIGALTGPARIYGNALDNQMTGSAAGETMLGGAGNDTIDGKAGNDILWGGAGNDTLISGAGNNVLHGGAGNDTIIGLWGANVLIGGQGDDIYDVTNSDFTVVEDANGGIDTIFASKHGVYLPANVENGSGNAEDGCSVRGNDLDNILGVGGFGFNFVEGRAGNDTIYASSETTINGGSGADHFISQPGCTFEYLNASESTPMQRDVYDSFDVQYDIIYLAPMDADSGQTGRQQFALVDAATRHAGELWLVNGTVSGVESTWVRGDVDGDKAPDFELLIPAVISDANLSL